MDIDKKSYRDVLREEQAPEKLINRLNRYHIESYLEVNGNKKVISHYSRSVYNPHTLELHVLNYTDDLLDTIYIDDNLYFDYEIEEN